MCIEKRKKKNKYVQYFRSLSVSPLLSDADVHALHQHFLYVELNRTEYEINHLSAEITSLSYDITDGPSQPAGLPPYSKAPDRYQVVSKSFLLNIAWLVSEIFTFNFLVSEIFTFNHLIFRFRSGISLQIQRSLKMSPTKMFTH